MHAQSTYVWHNCTFKNDEFVDDDVITTPSPPDTRADRRTKHGRDMSRTLNDNTRTQHAANQSISAQGTVMSTQYSVDHALIFAYQNLRWQARATIGRERATHTASDPRRMANSAAFQRGSPGVSLISRISRASCHVAPPHTVAAPNATSIFVIKTILCARACSCA